MQNRFVVLTGHLNDYPLADLVGILRHQRKTGRLLIEYPKGPASFFFVDGKLADAQVQNLVGLQAVCVALAQPASPFNFNPLIQPSRQSIDNSLQRVVSELLGCWDESTLEIDTTVTSKTLKPAEPLALPAKVGDDLVKTKREDALRVATLTEQRSSRRYRGAVLVLSVATLILGLSTVIAVTGGFAGKPVVATPPSAVAEHSLSTVSGNTTAPPAIITKAPRNEVRIQRQVPGGKEASSAFGPPAGPEARASATEEGKVNKLDANEPKPSSETIKSDEAKKSEQAISNSRPVTVVMQVENGRVLQASIANHRAGMDAFEATALRIARQRRYPSKTAGQETITVRVTAPNEVEPQDRR